MQTIGGAFKGVDHEIHLRWQHIRSWVESVFTRERITELVFFSFTLTLYAFLLFCLHRAVQNSMLVHPWGSLSYLN